MFSQIFSVIAIVLSLLRYGTYTKAIIAGTTKPHPLTWLGAGLMCGVAFVIQFHDNAGPTIWVSAVVTLFCIGIGIAAIFRGERSITTSDWVSFAFAIAVIPIWILTDQPMVALLLVLLIELLNYYPTVRKSFSKPWEEDVVSWSLSALRWFFATLAVTNFTPESFFYPAFLTVCEVALVAYFIIRRKILGKVRV